MLAGSEQGNANCDTVFFHFSPLLSSFLSFLSFRKKAVGPRPGGFCVLRYLEIFTDLLPLQAE